MEQMHVLLRRQLKKFSGSGEHAPADWASFLAAVNDAYQSAEVDRSLLERAMELSSQELVQANSRMRSISQALPDLALIVGKDGKILECHRPVQTASYRLPEGVVGMSIRDYVGAEIKDSILGTAADVLEKRSIVLVEYSFPGEMISYFEARLVGLSEEQFLVFIRDISARKRAMEALRENEEKFHQLFDMANEAFLLIDADKVVEFNAKTIEVFGYTREQLNGHRPSDFSPPFQPDGQPSGGKARRRRDAAMAGEPQFFEWLHMRADGTTFYADVNLARICLGGAWYLQVIIRDISERKKAEEAQKRLVQDLAQMNKLMTGRELKMIELKKEINELCTELGRPARYSTAP